MPFSQTRINDTKVEKDELDYIYSEVIKKAVSEYKENDKIVFNDVSRYESKVGSIIDGIINKIQIADLVIADLTGLNHNVMYELGVRHTLKRGTIIITRDIESIPSDLRDYMCLPYSYSDNTKQQKINYENFALELHNSIREILTTEKVDSPVLNYLKGKERYWKEEEIKEVKENIIITSYVLEQYDEIQKILSEISIANNANLLKAFAKFSAIINSIANAIGDLNISVETAILYDNIQAAKLTIAEVQKRSVLTEYFADFIPTLSPTEAPNFDQIKLTFFNQKYIDYFKLLDGDELTQISIQQIFAEDGDFDIMFLDDLKEYLQSKAVDLGLSENEIDYMLQN